MHNLIEFLEMTYKEKSNTVALDCNDELITFGELRERSLHVAKGIIELRKVQCEKKMIIILLPKGKEALYSMLGIMYSGNVYVPIDYKSPVNRIKQILQITEPILIISDEAGKQRLIQSGVSSEIIFNFENFVKGNSHISDDFINFTLSNTQDVDAAYLLFTSGSTGVPKGVVIPHKRVINYVKWAKDYFGICENDQIANQAPFYFTVSALDIYLTLATGARLCLVPENLFAQPLKLIEFLDNKGITVIFWVSSVYHHIAKSKALEEIIPRNLRYAWFVGEPMATTSLKYWMNHLPDVNFYNLYGSTETDMTICYQMPKDYVTEQMIPLGIPCANTEIKLLREDMSIVLKEQEGEIAEICVRGTCLALGYYKDIQKSQKAFIQDPTHNDYQDLLYKTGDLGEYKNGLIFFHGRKDHQFKHLGYRIEAGEIEAVIGCYQGIKNACVLYDSEKSQIVLFYEPDDTIDELSLRRFLLSELPVYMVPTRYVKLDEMPFNANKKKNRVLLYEKYIG